jgi:hypothetical protein
MFHLVGFDTELALWCGDVVCDVPGLRHALCLAAVKLPRRRFEPSSSHQSRVGRRYRRRTMKSSLVTVVAVGRRWSVVAVGVLRCRSSLTLFALRRYGLQLSVF